MFENVTRYERVLLAVILALLVVVPAVNGLITTSMPSAPSAPSTVNAINPITTTLLPVNTTITLTPSVKTLYPQHTVTWTVTLKTTAGVPLANKTVRIYHYYNTNLPDYKLYNDTYARTNAYGKVTFTENFGWVGGYTFYARFYGATPYKAATSAPVKITVLAPQPTIGKLRLAAAGDVRLLTTANLDTLKAMGFVEIHVVVPDAGLYTNMLNAIRARGMVAVYDGEVPFWLNRGFSGAPYTATEMAQLRAIYAAGWRDFASEGLIDGQVTQINSVGFRYYNYGCDQGLCMQCSGYYTHPPTSHYANYMEFYTAALSGTTLATIKCQAATTPLHNGILFGLWTNDVINNGATYITQFNAQGAKISTVLFWGGLNMNPLTYIGEGRVYHQAYHNVRALNVTPV